MHVDDFRSIADSLCSRPKSLARRPDTFRSERHSRSSRGRRHASLPDDVRLTAHVLRSEPRLLRVGADDSRWVADSLRSLSDDLRSRTRSLRSRVVSWARRTRSHRFHPARAKQRSPRASFNTRLLSFWTAIPPFRNAFLTPRRSLLPFACAPPTLLGRLPSEAHAMPSFDPTTAKQRSQRASLGSQLLSFSTAIASLRGALSTPRRPLVSFAYARPSLAPRFLGRAHSIPSFTHATARQGSPRASRRSQLPSLGRRGPWARSPLLCETCDRPSPASEPPSFRSGRARPGRTVPCRRCRPASSDPRRPSPWRSTAA